MSDLKEKMAKITGKKSGWYEDAVARRSTPWLGKYSAPIALRILTILHERKDLTQARLAEQLNVSPQQISKIVKGHENLTLETIYKLSQALGEELITFPPSKKARARRNTPPEPPAAPAKWRPASR